MKYDELTSIKKISELRNEASLKLKSKQALKMRILQSILDVRAIQTKRQMSRSIFSFKSMPIFASLFVMAMLSGGVSYAAQSALPGDALYPVKVGINEKVRSAVAIGAKAQAQWEVRRTQIRLQEASELADQGRELDDEEEARLESRFAASADAALEEAAELQTEGDQESADAIASELESVLKVQVRVMDRVKTNARLRAATNQRLDAAVKTRTEAGARVSADFDASTQSRKAAQGKIESAGNIIKEARIFVERKRNKVQAETYAQALARLVVAEGVLAQAKTKLEAGVYNEAFITASGAARIAQEAKVLFTASIRIPGIRIELNSSLDTIVSGEIDHKKMENKSKEEKDDENDEPIYLPVREQTPTASPTLRPIIKLDTRLNLDL